MAVAAGFSAWLGFALLTPAGTAPEVAQVTPPTNAAPAASAQMPSCGATCTESGETDAQTAPATPPATPALSASSPGMFDDDDLYDVLPPPPPALPEVQKQDVQDETTDILVSGHRHVRYDPLEKVNKVSFDAVQAVDRAVVSPLSNTYERIVPEPARDGIHNMVHNLREPYIAINFLLQHRVGKSVETVGRLIINSTIGVAGLFDIAKRKPFHLPRRPNGFADTMAFYGVRSGPYLFLPLVGPTTIRDLLGNTLDRLVIPLSIGRVARNPLYGAPLVVFGAMDRRLKNNGRIEGARKAADPYAAMREDYMLRRRLEIEGLHYHRPRKDKPAKLPPRVSEVKPAEGAAPTPS
jgi:phospholipid-binding lipoprotein MlaA